MPSAAEESSCLRREEESDARRVDDFVDLPEDCAQSVSLAPLEEAEYCENSPWGGSASRV